MDRERRRLVIRHFGLAIGMILMVAAARLNVLERGPNAWATMTTIGCSIAAAAFVILALRALTRKD